MARATRQFIDLDAAFTYNPKTRDVASKSDDNAIRGALRNLILTNLYEKPFQPNFGSRIRGLLFEDVSFITANILQTEISNVIANFEPRVGVDAIRVQANPEQNRYDVAIRFFINNLEAPVTINFFLEKVR